MAKWAVFKAYIPGALKDSNHEGAGYQRSEMPVVLVVEDDESIREYFEEELRAMNYEVVTAEDGEEGIHAYFRYKPDVILSDIRMPNVDGLEFLARIRMTDKVVLYSLYRILSWLIRRPCCQ